MDIRHRVAAKGCTPAQAYAALTTPEGLSGWWMEGTGGDTAVGGVIEFPTGLDMSVQEGRPGSYLRWEPVKAPDEWLGTSIEFELEQDGDWTVVLFTHAGWREPSRFMHHCSLRWATYLLSLKKLLETGDGDPYPREIEVGDWR